MKAFIVFFLFVWVFLGAMSLIALTQSSGWSNLIILAILVLSAKNIAGFFQVLKDEIVG